MTAMDNTHHQQITDLIYQYCRAVDRLDIELGHSLWHEPSYADYGADYYQGPGKGVIDVICQHHQQTLMHSHQITNILLAVEGTNARSESYCTANLRLEKSGQLMQITVWTRYLDRWAFIDGRWGLTKRTAVRDFDEIRPVQALSESSIGRRDKHDLSYELFQSLEPTTMER